VADTIDVTDAQHFIPEVWAAEVLTFRESALVMAPLVKRFDSAVKERGDTVHVPNVSELKAENKAANTEVVLQVPTETETTISINKHKHVAFEIEDIAKVQSQYDLRSAYTKSAGYAIAKVVDADLLALYASLTSTDVGTYGNDIDDGVIVSAIQALDEADAPLEDRAFVIAPSQKAKIMTLDKFVKADYLGQYDQPTPVRKGPNNRYLWGDIYGIPTYYTNQVPTTAGSPTQVHNIMFHKEAFALAMQMAPRTQASYWHKDLAWLVTVDTIYGVKVLRGDHGVEVRS
jgi:hypothetical protein